MLLLGVITSQPISADTVLPPFYYQIVESGETVTTERFDNPLFRIDSFSDYKDLLAWAFSRYKNYANWMIVVIRVN